jgi:hypothetical protein
MPHLGWTLQEVTTRHQIDMSYGTLGRFGKAEEGERKAHRRGQASTQWDNSYLHIASPANPDEMFKLVATDLWVIKGAADNDLIKDEARTGRIIAGEDPLPRHP